MIPAATLSIWLIALNISALLLFFGAYRRLASSRARTSFLVFVLGYLLWLNPLLLVQLHNSTDETGYFLAKLILAGGAIFVWSLGNFVITFCDPDERGRLRFKLFTLHFLLLFVFAFTSLLQTGITRLGSGLVPIKGPLQPYFDLSVITYGIYFVTLSVKAYRTSGDALFRAQLQTLVWSCVPSFLVGLCTNAVLPGAFGYFDLTPTGGLWLLLFFAGVAFILVNGPFLLVRSELRSLLQEPAFREKQNLLQFAQLLEWSTRLEQKDAPRSARSFTFLDNRQKAANLQLANIVGDSQVSSLSSCLELTLPQENNSLSSALREYATARQENIRLGEQLVHARSTNRNFDPVKESPSAEIVQDLSECFRELDQVHRAAEELWGFRSICLSDSFASSLKQLELLKNYRGLILCEGEIGSGRTTVCRNFLRQSHETITLHDLRLSEAIPLLPVSSPLLLTNASALVRAEKEEVLGALIGRGNITLLTLLPGESDRSPFLRELLLGGYVQRVRIPPLRERDEDLYYLILESVKEHSLFSSQLAESISERAIEDLQKHRFRGNFFELQFVIQHWLEFARSRTLDWDSYERSIRLLPNETGMGERLKKFINAEASL